jgi:fumarylacetoacetate (FAA) hydrolase
MKIIRYRTGSDAGARLGTLNDGVVSELVAASLLEWLEGVGRERTGTEVALTDVQVLSPFDAAPSFRDFSAFELHNKNGCAAAARLLPPGTPTPQVPAYWYEVPVFYFSHPGAFRGPGEPVARPEGCEWLDYELEIGGVVGADGDFAGFMLLNDWSARDTQMRESATRLGPQKGKDFGTSIGPWFVTPDELPYADGRLDLRVETRVNGELVAESTAADQYHSWPALLAQAARDTRLHTGDLIGSGTLGWGCLMEHGGRRPDGRLWLSPGDVVELRCDHLGTLTSTIE